MKKRVILKFAMSIVTLLITACSEENIFENDQKDRGWAPKQIGVTIPDFGNKYDTDSTETASNSQTTLRAGVDVNGTDYQFVWSKDDEIGIFPTTGGQMAFSMANGAGTKNAEFDGGGWALKASSAYSAYYPIVRDFDLDKSNIPMDLSNQIQTGNANYDHIGKLAYMSAVNSQVDENGVVMFNFNYLISVLHLIITVPQTGQFNRVMLMSSSNLTTKASLNLSDDEVTNKTELPLQMLELKNVEITNTATPLEVYMVIRPVDLTGKILKARIYADDGTAYVVDLTSKNYEAGNFYHSKRTAVIDNTITGLPQVFVNTPVAQSTITKDIWLEHASMTIVKTDGTIDYQGSMSIKGRGNSTWNYPKKPYALKLDSKSKILGMKKHKRWCLLANWMDRTMIRNAVAFEISRNTDLAWTPNGKYVEVIFNGVHRGNYYLCEQIKVDDNRVNIAELKADATEGNGITGGYLFELDTNYDEAFKFRPTRSNFPWMFKDPDEVNETQYNWAVNYVNEMEDALYDPTKFANREFADYMELESYVDWWFVNELTMNKEIGHPKSCYMYKDINRKMNAGPVWDFDWGTFTPSGTSSYQGKGGLYYPKLFADAEFVALVKYRWAIFKPDFENNIPVFIDNTMKQLKMSDKINAKMWPIGGSLPNGDESLSFEDAVARLKDAYLNKLKWLDNKIQNM